MVQHVGVGVEFGEGFGRGDGEAGHGCAGCEQLGGAVADRGTRARGGFIAGGGLFAGGDRLVHVKLLYGECLLRWSLRPVYPLGGLALRACDPSLPRNMLTSCPHRLFQMLLGIQNTPPLRHASPMQHALPAGTAP